MDKFIRLTAAACPLPLENVDTDQLIPARFMSRPRASGYGACLLHDLRFDEQGLPRRRIALDEDRFKGARILVARRNFGSGSSREAAVYALWDFGFRCIIAPSFGDIFASNAVKNGLLPAVVSSADAEALLDALSTALTPHLTVDLDRTVAFTVDRVRRLQLLNGWDDFDMTKQYGDRIAAHRSSLQANMSWIFPPPGGLAQVDRTD